jgi:hypothetical protein
MEESEGMIDIEVKEWLRKNYYWYIPIITALYFLLAIFNLCLFGGFK